MHREILVRKNHNYNCVMWDMDVNCKMKVNSNLISKYPEHVCALPLNLENF